MASKKSEQAHVLLLEEEVRNLSEELAQCQADKEFVWSLWKRLQVANPDLTQAVSLVVEREKQKAEAKDGKVLEILQVKDSKIRELQQQVTGQQQEINNIVQRKVAVDEENSLMKKELTALQQKLLDKSRELKDVKERTKKKEDERRLVVRNLEEEKKGLNTRCSDLLSDLEKLQKQAAHWEEEKSGIESKVKVLEEDIKEARQQVEDLHNKCNELSSQLATKHTELACKETDVTKCRKELLKIQNLYMQSTEHTAQQAELIQQLEGLNLETQKVLRNQEDAHTTETMSYQKLYNELNMCYEALQSSETQLRQSHISLTTQLHQKEQQISQLQAKLQQALVFSQLPARQTNAKHLEEETHHVSSEELEHLVAAQKAELKLLTEKLKIANMKLAAHTIASSDGSESNNQRGGRRHKDPPVKRSRSLSPKSYGRESEELQRLGIAPNKLQNLEELVKLKTIENEELRNAHEKRQDRLRLIQTNYRAVKEQLKEMEEGNCKTKSKGRSQRAEPWQLRQENSDAVWNELAYFKREHKKLLTEKVNLEEVLDQLRVQTATDKAAIQELNVCLQQEKEELLFRLGEDTGVKSSTPKKNVEENLEQPLKMVNLLERKLRAVEKEAKKLKDANEELTKGKSSLMASLARLRRVEESREDADELMKENRELKRERSELRVMIDEQEMRVASLKRQVANANELKQVNQELLLQAEGLQRALDTALASATQERATCECGLRAAGTKVTFKQARRKSYLRHRQAFLNQSIKEMSSLFENFNKDGWEDMSGDSDSDETQKRTTTQETCDSLTDDKESKWPCDDLRPPRKNLQPSSLKNYADKENKKRRFYRKKNAKPHQDTQQAANSESKPNKKKVVAQKRVFSLSLQQKILSLHQQIAVLQTGRRAALNTTRELRETNEKLTSQLNLVNQRFQLSKQVTQKLTSDLAELQQQKDALEKRIEQLKEQQAQVARSTEIQPPLTPGLTRDTPTSSTKNLELEIKQLQNKLKNSTNEIAKHVSANKVLKTDIQVKEDQFRELQDKLSRMERDITMKRQLVEDLKSRLRSSQENDKTCKKMLEDMEKKIKMLSDDAANRKTFIDSLKQRLSVATKEKNQYEEMHRKCKEELEKKNQKLQDLQSKVAESEIAMTELEETASLQMHGLAQQSTHALEVVQKKLGIANRQVEEFNTFVKALAREIHKDVQDTKTQIRKTKRKHSTPGGLSKESINRAQSIAASILNISQTDLEDILDTEDEDSEEAKTARRNDQEWLGQIEGILEGQFSFATHLMEAILVKMKERKMLTEEFASLRTEVSKKS
ncbi:centlein isoform X2 [Polyodon spathula]|uniref:centlein isoform X2 n=1 Tax=Polyodon spathula TaxID=7913 RepID=UPI001B7E35A6|nr:centlein isoform X2 [Polyodon spathula]